MADFADIRAGLAANLATLTDPGVTIGGESIPFQVSGYFIGATSPTVMVVGVEEINYDISFGNEDASVIALVQAVVGDTTEIPPQVLLDTLLFGATSVRKLLLTDRTLGGSCADFKVPRMSGLFTPVGTTKRVLGAEWFLEIEVNDP